MAQYSENNIYVYDGTINDCLANNCNAMRHGAVAIPKIDQILTQDDFSFLAITFDVGHQMTR